MVINSTKGWQDYELLDSGEGRKLERFGEFILDRPDPQIIWKKTNEALWNNASARFERTSGDKGRWIQNISIPEKWPIIYKNTKFWVKLTPFKHTGIFPEQSTQWDFINNTISSTNKVKNILNLFAYTGAASIIAAKAGANVTHVDASRPAVTWANENRDLNGLQNAPIRWIVDDALSFTEREAKRGVKYDGIIMDPPVYGHGPKGDVWEFNKNFPELLNNCKLILSETPLFVLVNTYAISTSSITIGNILKDKFASKNSKVEYGELAIEQKNTERLLSTGIWGSVSW